MPVFEQVLGALTAIANPEKALLMKAYMRDQFEFLGVPSQPRKEAVRGSLIRHKLAGGLCWEFIDSCWADPHRELQYVALDYLDRNKSLLDRSHLGRLKRLATKKSWWDTVDALAHIVGEIMLNFPELKPIMVAWSTDENLWVRRIAIEHQLSHKLRTDTELLEKILANNFGVREFFINKAIGWALRDYSKANARWVSEFIERYRTQLAPLSLREGGKYI
ncbi:MAG: DNA alkylation repair protein [Chloroflexi bacterium]|nr:DNA alkylation repair protein [Chloroflexota bacterium]